MANPRFEANVNFEMTSESNKWAVYRVKDLKRGELGVFRINKENGYCDDRDEHGVLQLSPYFSGQMSEEDFAQRFELLNWVYEVFGLFMEEGKWPPMHFVST